MARKTLDQDDGADELSLDQNTMPPPSRTRANGNRTTNYKEIRSMSPYPNASNSNAGSAKKTATRSSSRTASPSPSNQPASSNPSRKRAAPNTVKSPPTKRGKPAPKLKLNAPKRVREDIYNEPDRLLGPKRSPIYNYNNNIIPAILLDQTTQQILATTEIGYKFKDVRYDVLMQACATFQTDGSEGRHDVDWLAEAWQAHHDRLDGKFDEMNEAKFKENWVTGVESGEEYSDSEDESGVVSGKKGIAESANANSAIEEVKKTEQVEEVLTDEVQEQEARKEETEKDDADKEEFEEEALNGTAKEGNIQDTKSNAFQGNEGDGVEYIMAMTVKGVNGDNTKDVDDDVKKQEETKEDKSERIGEEKIFEDKKTPEAKTGGEIRDEIAVARGEGVDLVQSIELGNGSQKADEVKDRAFVYISE